MIVFRNIISPRLFLMSLLATMATWSSPTTGQDEAATTSITARSRAFDEAFAAADPAALNQFLTNDMIVLSLGGHALSKAEVEATHRELFRDRPGITMTHSPDRIDIASADWGVASEQGSWVEKWPGEHGEVILTGTYTTLWRQVDGEWCKAAEMLIALTCQGSYCR